MCYKNCIAENSNGECTRGSNFPCQLIECKYCGEEVEAQDIRRHLQECEIREDEE